LDVVVDHSQSDERGVFGMTRPVEVLSTPLLSLNTYITHPFNTSSSAFAANLSPGPIFVSSPEPATRPNQRKFDGTTSSNNSIYNPEYHPLLGRAGICMNFEEEQKSHVFSSKRVRVADNELTPNFHPSLLLLATQEPQVDTV
jgi:hypothetical protein